MCWPTLRALEQVARNLFWAMLAWISGSPSSSGSQPWAANFPWDRTLLWIGPYCGDIFGQTGRRGGHPPFLTWDAGTDIPTIACTRTREFVMSRRTRLLKQGLPAHTSPNFDDWWQYGHLTCIFYNSLFSQTTAVFYTTSSVSICIRKSNFFLPKRAVISQKDTYYDKTPNGCAPAR